MRCKKCGWVSKYPVCNDCATEEEKRLIEELGNISRNIRGNRKKLIKYHLKLPVLSPIFYTAMAIFFALLSVYWFFAEKINNPLIQLFFGIVAPLFLMAIIFLTWGDLPEENISNGLKTIDLKYQNIILHRHRKKYFKLLTKPYDNWTSDDKIEVRFDSYETALGETI